MNREIMGLKMRFMKGCVKKLMGILTVLSLTAAPSAQAVLCAPDVTPAATLLFPYFEVAVGTSCASSNGVSTDLSITNASAATMLVHVVFWTAWGVPALDFDLQLVGYATEDIDIKALLCDGTIPGTDGASGFGRVLTNSQKAHVNAWFTGNESPSSNNCAGPESGNKAIGYVTVDNVTNNITGSPADGASYINNLSHQNVLLGDYYINDKRVKGLVGICSGSSSCLTKAKSRILKERGIHGAPAVHIESDTAGALFQSGDHTFYGRYVSGNATDKREPLPDSFHVRYRQSVKKKKIELIAWRETSSSAEAVSCGSTPSWSPLDLTQMVAFDTESNAEDVSDEYSFPNATQAYKKFAGPLPFQKGWVFMNLNHSGVSSVYSTNQAQSWLITRRDGIIDSAGVHSFSNICPNRSYNTNPNP